MMAALGDPNSPTGLEPNPNAAPSIPGLFTRHLNPNAIPFTPRSHQGAPANSWVRFGFINICSLRHKVDALEQLIADQCWDIVGVAETWLDGTVSDGEIRIPNFSIARQDRAGGRGGGTCIYFRSTLPVKPRPDLTADDVECTWIELKGARAPHLLGCVYRPPSETVAFWPRLETVLQAATNNTGSVTMMGDFNVNADPVSPGPQLRHMHDTCGSYGLQNVVTAPTRVLPQCVRGTILDLVLVNHASLTSWNIVPCDISDHFAVSASLSCATEVSQPASSLLTRQLHRVDIAALRADLLAADLHIFPPHASVDDMWSTWHASIMRVLDHHAPMTPVKKRSRRRPWLNRDTYQLTMAKNRLHRRWLRDRANIALFHQYKRARTAAANLVRRRKNQYFSDECVVNNRNPRKMWSLLNSITGRGGSKQDPACDVNKVSVAFSNIVTDPDRPAHLPLPNGPPAEHSLSCLGTASYAAVNKLLQAIIPVKATGSDGIPGLLLKSCSDILTPSLTRIFNESLETGIVPSAFKKALVRPLYKSGDPTSPGNYRPVSLLPIASKLLEKLVQRQLVAFLDEHNVLPPTQFAFRKDHSTEDALVLLTDGVLTAKDSALPCCICLLDMSKAFDKVSHPTLLQDLFDIGVSGTALSWFANYLSHRTQQVRI
eukprot:scpid40375/ scgid17431/ RNA-directed DNA polymerase from mobile element jockey; Reverse transcriptase